MKGFRPVKSTMIAVALCSLVSISSVSLATNWVSVRPLDEQHLILYFRDSHVVYQDDGKGPTAFMGHESKGGDRVEVYGKPMNLEEIKKSGAFLISSINDASFKATVKPISVFRKTKVSGTAWKWPDPDPSYEHTLFLKLPKKLQSGKKYTLTLSDQIHSDKKQMSFSFDSSQSESEAIHVNLIGYSSGNRSVKSADLYAWMGDGGARDYSSFVGRPVFAINQKTRQKQKVGTVKFWKPSGTDVGDRNLTASPVWTCDLSALTQSGNYRISIEGIGVSPAFQVNPKAYAAPFKTSVQGFYFMRIGEPKNAKVAAPPRQPRFIPGKDPAGFTVYLTTYAPWHPDWKKKGGDQWDNIDWSMYLEPGKPTNPNAYGGHSDALDWDRHMGHISIIWDLLLPYILTNGKGGEDNLGIRESGNGIPDIIDEAQNEVDFWLRLRDTKGGYGSGLNNPSKDYKTMYQGAARPYMAWASAANCSMLANAFKLAKKPALMKKYRDEAIKAWKFANEQDLDFKHAIGNGAVTGRDLKQMAAAYLYNATGDRKYEDALRAHSVITGPKSDTEKANESNQLWGTAAYLMNHKYRWQPVRYPDLVANMRQSVIAEAMAKNVSNTVKWPSRRSTDNAYGWFQSVIENQRVCVAHAVSNDPIVSRKLMDALVLESDYSLGRNPINSVLMTGLGSRHVDYIYTSGNNDGVPGSHPGHTPYMNVDNWGQGFMADPGWMANRGYPEWKQWPHGEAIWRARYCYSNNEFTPQQSMRGKHCLYGYLHGLTQ